MPTTSISSRIYLTGFMGSGKSTVGPLLARMLDYEFVELDSLVQEKLGKSIASAVEEDGEAAFRKAEASVLAASGRAERTVVATGGGTLASEAAMKLATASGSVVYLRARSLTLVGRLEGSSNRPLLTDAEGRPLSPEQLVTRIEHLLAIRSPYYRRANVIVDVDGLPPDAVVAAVLEAII